MTISRSRLFFGLGTSLVLVTLAVTACSSDATTSTPSGADAAATPDGGGAPESGASDTSTATDTSTAADTGGACNAVVNGAVLVSEAAGVGAKPAPAGGTIADGTYYLTKHEVFAPGTPDANTRRRTIVFSGNAVQTHENDTGKPETQTSGTYTTSGSNITFTLTCPSSVAGLQVTIPYTATSTTFATFAAAADGDIFTSTKQ